MRDDLDFQFVLIAAFRYTLGRRTYAPTLLSAWLREHADLVAPETWNLIREELAREIRRDNQARKVDDPRLPLGHDCDRETWLGLARWIDDRRTPR